MSLNIILYLSSFVKIITNNFVETFIFCLLSSDTLQVLKLFVLPFQSFFLIDVVILVVFRRSYYNKIWSNGQDDNKGNKKNTNALCSISFPVVRTKNQIKIFFQEIFLISKKTIIIIVFVRFCLLLENVFILIFRWLEKYSMRGFVSLKN